MENILNNRLWNEWREKKINQNRRAEGAMLLLSEGYKKSKGLKRLYFALKYLWLDKHGQFDLPQSEIEALARCFLPDILAYFESEKGKAEFAAWKAEQERIKAKNENKSKCSTSDSPFRKVNL